MPLRRPLPALAAAILAGTLLSACDRPEIKGCSGREGAAARLNRLELRIERAIRTGRLEPARAGDFGARIVEAGSTATSAGDFTAYCATLEHISRALPAD